jgi:hypothetical protein
MKAKWLLALPLLAGISVLGVACDPGAPPGGDAPTEPVEPVEPVNPEEPGGTPGTPGTP